MGLKRRLSASVDAELMQAAEDAVAEGLAPTLSAWVADAMRLKLAQQTRLQALGQLLAEYEAQHGEITSEEIRAAKRRARSRAVVVRAPDQASEER